MILITALPPSKAPGAVPTGPVGRCLANRFLSSGKRVRVLAPESEATGWPEGVEILTATITNPAATPNAFQGVEQVFLAGLVSMVPETLREFTNLAIKGEVKRIAILSSHGSDFESEYSPATWQWLAFERAIEKHGAELTYIRPTGVFANALVGGYPITGSSWARYIKAGETIQEFYPRISYPFIDEEDLVGVIAEVLLNCGYHGKVLDISGTMISAAERLRLISEALGKNVQLEELISDDLARTFWKSQGWPDITIEVTLWAAKEFTAHMETNKQHLRKQEEITEHLVCRSPRTFSDWVTEHIEDFSA